MYAVWYHYPLWYSVWKPAWIPTTFGDKPSFLEYLLNKPWDEINQLQKVRSENSISHEYGLINRLDNDTTWLLFFAKTPEIYLSYKQKQSQGQIQKIYYADLYGNCFQHNDIRDNTLIVNSSLFHHMSDPKRMTINPRYGRWREHKVTTMITPLYYDALDHTTTCSLIITKGIRHQIRVHTASIGHHIIGEKLYLPKGVLSQKFLSTDCLHLRSMWIRILS